MSESKVTNTITSADADNVEESEAVQQHEVVNDKRKLIFVVSSVSLLFFIIILVLAFRNTTNGTYVLVNSRQIYTISMGSKSRQSILLLHGSAFSSATWVNLNILNALASSDFYAIAIDLPGFGESDELPNQDRASFLDSLLVVLEIDKPVLVSPSLSGIYSIPFVINNGEKLSGFVPVAPVIPFQYTSRDFRRVQVPTLIIYGENDISAASSTALLSQIPNSTIGVIPDGSHPAYVDDPEGFQNMVIIFAKSLSIKQTPTKVVVDGSQINFKTAGTKSRQSILLLHGSAFSSATWVNLNILNALASSGFYAIAIDLPGFGKSDELANQDRASFLDKLLVVLEINKPVLVSPSISGIYSIPFVINNGEKLSGFVPVAPVIPSHYSAQRFSTVQVPTLIIYGENDIGAASSTALLSQIPNSNIEVIPDGSHPAYVDNPELFQNLVINFAQNLN